MSSSESVDNIRSETFYSQVLLTGEFAANEETGRRERSVFDGTGVKVITLPKLLWLLRHAPASAIGPDWDRGGARFKRISKRR